MRGRKTLKKGTGPFRIKSHLRGSIRTVTRKKNDEEGRRRIVGEEGPRGGGKQYRDPVDEFVPKGGSPDTE